MIKKLLPSLAAAVFVSYGIMIILNTDVVSDGIVKAISRCLNIIIPSLFAFMALSGLLINTKLYKYIVLPFYPITKFILKMPNSLFAVFILGNIGGYPVGIKLLSILVKEKRISKKAAQIMSCYCFGAGPAFLTGAVGLAVFGQRVSGLIIFASIVLTNFIMAIVSNRIFKLETNEQNEKLEINAKIFVESIENAAKSLFSMCSIIIIFSTFMSLLDKFDIFDIIISRAGLRLENANLLRSFFEITTIAQSAHLPQGYLPIVSALCGFGGLCVFLQITAINEKSFPLKMFFVTKPISFVLNLAISYVLFNLFADKSVAVSTINSKIIVDFNNFVPSICLIMMIFLLLLRKRLAIFNDM